MLKRQFKWRWSSAAVGCGAALIAVSIAAAFMESFLVGAALFVSGVLLCRIGWEIVNIRQDWLRLSNLENLISTTDSVVIMTDRKGIITSFNSAAERALGYGALEVVGHMTPAQFHPEDDQRALAEQVAKQEWAYLRRDGTSFPALVTTSSIRNELGEIVGYFEMGIDISARKAGEIALREKQELIESIAATSPTLFHIYDLTESSIVYANRELAETLGYEGAQIAEIGLDPLPKVIHPEDLDILFNRYQSCATLRDGEVLETELRCLSANRELRWLYARDVVFKRDSDGKPVQILVNMVDITERKLLDEQIENQVLEIQDTNLALEIQTNALEEANAQLEALAFTDGLTGIANHRSFQEELAKSFDLAKKRKRKLSLMLIDVDRFKQYNDTYGHPSGDIVLKRVASVIRDSCPLDCTPARYGGEEFAVLCPGFSASEVLTLAEHIRGAIENTPWPERSVTISIGAVAMSAEVNSPSDLVTASDNALYSSKASGRNCVTFYDFEKRSRLAS